MLFTVRIYPIYSDSPENKEALGIIMKEVKVANPEFQSCHIRGKHTAFIAFACFMSLCKLLTISCLFVCSSCIHILQVFKSRGIPETKGERIRTQTSETPQRKIITGKNILLFSLLTFLCSSSIETSGTPSNPEKVHSTSKCEGQVE